LEGRESERSLGTGVIGMACSGRFFGLRTSGASNKLDSRGASDGDCEYRVGFFI
jgi:hypothetical protein